MADDVRELALGPFRIVSAATTNCSSLPLDDDPKAFVFGYVALGKGTFQGLPLVAGIHGSEPVAPLGEPIDMPARE